MMLTGMSAACRARTTGCIVAAGGFTNDVGAGMGPQEFAELDMALGVIGQGVKTVRKVQLQRELGNIEADVEDNGIVLTHTCKDTSPGDRWSPCSSNGSSLGQVAHAEHAGERITPKRMLGEDVPARAVALWPAGQRATPSSRLAFSQARKMENNIQAEQPSVRRYNSRFCAL